MQSGFNICVALEIIHIHGVYIQYVIWSRLKSILSHFKRLYCRGHLLEIGPAHYLKATGLQHLGVGLAEFLDVRCQ